ncbi:MAG: DUF507 family protein [Deltaproteobacteria bacterium]|nr:DUF507 family protein [Deltaproteobacteria bacterium]
MRLSDDRISHIAHLIADGIWRDDLIDFTKEKQALISIKEIISNYLSVEDHADTVARHTIQSLSKDVPEGSREWDILYRKYFEEELAKKNF